MAITQLLSLNTLSQWGIKQTAAFENNMTSVERILEYSNVESEIDNKSNSNTINLVKNEPKSKWPTNGCIEFKNVSLRYGNNSSFALQNLNLKCQPAMKIGIVGRTGAGKSSIIQTLFRLVDFDGDIEIDGINTMTINVQELREKISVIPQTPILFSGSVRKNLDPHLHFTDDALWQALEKVKLKFIRFDNNK